MRGDAGSAKVAKREEWEGQKEVNITQCACPQAHQQAQGLEEGLLISHTQLETNCVDCKYPLCCHEQTNIYIWSTVVHYERFGFAVTVWLYPTSPGLDVGVHLQGCPSSFALGWLTLKPKIMAQHHYIDKLITMSTRAFCIHERNETLPKNITALDVWVPQNQVQIIFSHSMKQNVFFFFFCFLLFFLCIFLYFFKGKLSTFWLRQIGMVSCYCVCLCSLCLSFFVSNQVNHTFWKS